jgi:hypothetical protein
MIRKEDCLEIGGGGSGPALRLKENFETGDSFKSGTYKNEPLHSGKTPEFKIKQVELFVLY